MKKLLFTSLTILLYSCTVEDFADNEKQIKENVTLDSLEVFTNLHLDPDENNCLRQIKVGNHLLIVQYRMSDQIMSIVNHGQSNAVAGKLSNDTIVVQTAPVSALFVIVEESLLGSDLQENVKDYILNLYALKEQDYEIVDNFILQYEIGKRADQTLAVDEKNTILSISSISEATIYGEKKRKDRDWETSTTSRRKE
jgi:hypothetical protein